MLAQRSLRHEIWEPEGGVATYLREPSGRQSDILVSASWVTWGETDPS